MKKLVVIESVISDPELRDWQASVLAFRETGQNAFQCCFPDRGNQGAAGRLGREAQGDFG